MSRTKIGLVLTGGGARAAYQVGALKAIAEITGFHDNPFSIISGYSAGAINGAWLASHSGQFAETTSRMTETWSRLTVDQVYRADTISLGTIALRWLRDRGSGGLGNQLKQITHLLDTAPLLDLIRRIIDFNALNSNLENGNLHALSISATEYRTGESIAFYNGKAGISDWEKLNRKSARTKFTAEHILASSAIPIFFPPVKIGNSFFGDGMIRLNSPLSSAIHLGADKLLVISNRGPAASHQPDPGGEAGVTLGDIAGTILNGLFFDSLDGDLDRLGRINRGVSVMSPDILAAQPDHLRRVPFLTLSPEDERLKPPTCELSRMPATLRFLLRGLGVSAKSGSNLLSYIAFEPAYMQSLIEAGQRETMLRKRELVEFFASA